MPAHDAARRRLSLAVEDEDEHAGRVSSALLAWAEADDGALLLLDRGPAGRTALRWVNVAGARLLGYDAEELVGQPLERILRSPFSAAHRRRRVGAARRRPPSSCAARSPSSAGTAPRCASCSPACRCATRPHRGWVVRLVLEPDAERVADDLRTSHERFRALADRAPIAIFCSEAGLRARLPQRPVQRAVRRTGLPPRGHGLARPRAPGRPAGRHLGDDPRARGAAQELPMRVLRSDGAQRAGARPHRPGARRPPRRRLRRHARGRHRAPGVRGLAGPPGVRATCSRGCSTARRLLELLDDDLVRSRPGAGRAARAAVLDLDDFKQVNDELRAPGRRRAAASRCRADCARRCATATSCRASAATSSPSCAAACTTRPTRWT